MKYLKTFENKNLYKLGDHILIIDPKPDTYTIVVDVKNAMWNYMIETYEIYTGNMVERFPISDDEIVRKLTTEEIEEIETKKDMKKYNL